VSFPAYPEYKDSGVPWLGEVPAQWKRKPLFALAKELDDRNVGMQEDNLLSLSYGKIKRKNIEDNDGLLPASFETYQIVERDDIVWRLTDLQNDQRSLRTGIVRERGIITSAYLATRPTAVLPEFLAYLLRTYDLTKVFYSMGGGLRQSMKFSDVKWLPIMLPSDAEQAAIAAFLDRETAKIDALVAEQERLIALLKEKR
jgi:type I restriction enzyme S subunit